MLAVNAGSEYVPVGMAYVLPNRDGDPDTYFKTKYTAYECGHGFWSLIGPTAEGFVEQLDQVIIWRGPFARVGESLLEWFMARVHEEQQH